MQRLSGMSGPADWSMKAERAEALTRTKAFGDEFIEKVQNPPGNVLIINFIDLLIDLETSNFIYVSLESMHPLCVTVSLI